ncbi:MAG: hypothetical protein J0H06_08315 [Actinobacteria bacterium]|nr:hypothetical protein [Actinomycetota bacterium]OJU84913.1 MAG: hypothetical protein BGO11_19330 [Solirubrobacterales bacterium 70-9]
MPVNPEAVAWYLERSERLLVELRERVLAQRSRGAQIAGFSGAVLALVGANAESTLSALHGSARVCAAGCLLMGSLLLVVAFVTALRGGLLPRFVSDLSVGEVANYATDRFVQEPDLWRVHLRTIRGTIRSIESTTLLGDRTAEAIARAERFFIAGMSLVGSALGILVVVVAF